MLSILIELAEENSTMFDYCGLLAIKCLALLETYVGRSCFDLVDIETQMH